MSIKCEINFENNPMKVIHSGQLLKGMVQLKFKKQKKVRGIYIRLYGGAYTSWTEFLWFNNGCNHIWYNEHFKTYTGKEEYFNEQAYFLGGDSHNENKPLKKTTLIFKMSPGIHSYTFECPLPANLPTSIEGKHGHIRYIACVCVDVLHSEKRIFHVPFSVIKPADLNADPELRNPIIERFDKNSLEMFVCIPAKAYAPGQIINVEIDVKNQRKQKIYEFSVELVREIIYSISTKSEQQKIERASLIKTKTRGCDKFQSEIILCNISVPATAPTDLSLRNILKTRYFMRVVGFTDSILFRHNNPILEFPITIGSYPILDDSPYTNWSNGIIPFEHLDLNKYPLIYEETIGAYGASDSNYRPKYPVFRQITSYSSRS